MPLLKSLPDAGAMREKIWSVTDVCKICRAIISSVKASYLWTPERNTSGVSSSCVCRSGIPFSTTFHSFLVLKIHLNTPKVILFPHRIWELFVALILLLLSCLIFVRLIVLNLALESIGKALIPCWLFYALVFSAITE